LFKSTKNILLFEIEAFAIRAPPVVGRNAGFHLKEGTLGALISWRDWWTSSSVYHLMVQSAQILKMSEILLVQCWSEISGEYFGASANNIGYRIVQYFVP